MDFEMRAELVLNRESSKAAAGEIAWTVDPEKSAFGLHGMPDFPRFCQNLILRLSVLCPQFHVVWVPRNGPEKSTRTTVAHHLRRHRA